MHTLNIPTEEYWRPQWVVGSNPLDFNISRFRRHPSKKILKETFVIRSLVEVDNLERESTQCGTFKKRALKPKAR